MQFDPVMRLPLGDVPLPVMYPATVRFPAEHVADINASVQNALATGGILGRVRPGMRVAVGVGSRGVAEIVAITRAAVGALRHAGAVPFIVPAMGSHGGATAEGQHSLLAELGITEEAVGAPIYATMEVVELGRLPQGPPVNMDRYAYEADATLLINRIKPHTDFHGPIESGLAKMCAIGLGKTRTAEAIHAYGPSGLRDLMPLAARIVVEKGRVIGGLAVLENAYHQVAEIVGVPPEGIGMEIEITLQARAKALLPSLPFEQLDVLVVDEMGKNISGAGMDTGVIGRMWLAGMPEPPRPRINAIVTLSLTAESHGNAAGIGLADIITERYLATVNWNDTLVNAITSGVFALWRTKIPWVAPDDGTAIRLGLRLCGRPKPEDALLVRIHNTLCLDKIWISEALRPLARALHHVEVSDRSVPWRFLPDGRLA
jgi:hypothetical protein